MTRSESRMLWLLRNLLSVSWSGGSGFTTAWDSDHVDAFITAFPEAERSTVFYTIGAHSCPMLNRAAKRAERAGFLEAGSIGNEEAKRYNQRTWCRTWSVTDAGRKYVEEMNKE